MRFMTVFLFSCSTAFPTDADDVDIVGPHTYVVTDMRTVIEIPVTSVVSFVFIFLFGGKT